MSNRRQRLTRVMGARQAHMGAWMKLESHSIAAIAGELFN